LKVTADSRELADAVSAAEGYTEVTGSALSRAILLTAADGFLLLRTTTFKQDAILSVNAIGELEPGSAVVPSQVLAGATFDDGGTVVIESEKRLALTYESGAKLKIAMMAAKPDEFPVLAQTTPIVSLSQDIISVAARHCDKPGAGAMTIRSSIHLVPGGEGCKILATNGTIGFCYELDSTVDEVVSIDSAMLANAARAVGGMVNILVGDNRIEVKAQDGPRRIQFPETWSQDPSKLVDMFKLESAAQFKVSHPELKRLAFLASRAASIDEVAELLVEPTGDVQIAGQGIDISASIAIDGESLRSTFFAQHLAKSLRNIPAADGDFEVSAVELDNKEGARLWYIDGIGRHFITCAASSRFKA